MKKTFYFLTLFIFSFNLLAQDLSLDLWKNAIVKIKSYPCLTQRPQFSGSGFLIKSNDRLQVITSEHVLIQDNGEKFCHEISNHKITSQITKIKSIDYMKGLSLLEVEKTDKLKDLAIDIKSLQPPKLLAASTNLVALGFPADSEQLQALNGGKLISTQSLRAWLPEVPEMIEASGLPVEYGMSGGVLLSQTSEDRYVFSGLLSHQILRRSAGAGGQVDIPELNRSAGVEDLALAIPATLINTWLNSYPHLNEMNWRRDAEAQINEREVITLGPLRFELEKMAAATLFSTAGADGTGIGGADGTGIGGGTKSSPEFLGVVNITLNPHADYNLKVASLNDPLLNTWRSWLLQGQSVKIIFLRGTNSHRLLRFSSLAQMFTLWKRAQNVPVTLRSINGHSDQAEASLKNLLRMSQKVAQLAQTERELALNNEDKAWFGLLRDSSLLAQQSSISSLELRALLTGPNDQHWRQFYDANFDAAVALESAIQSLCTHLKEMGW